MSRITEKIVLILLDLVALNLAFFLVYVLKFHSGLMEAELPPSLSGVVMAGAALSILWILNFILFGLYSSKFAISRTDEIVSIFKAVTFGIVILFILLIDLENLLLSRFNIFNYWALLVFFLSLGHIIVRTYQRNRLKKGRGRRKTLIVGNGKRAHEIYEQILSQQLTGFDVQGFIDPDPRKQEIAASEGTLGALDQFDAICDQHQIEEVLIILDKTSKKKLFEIVDMCNGYPVALKTIPDIYEIAVGNARIQHIYGLDLVEILPENYSPGFRLVKRITDISVSALVLFLFLPIWVLISMAIRINSRGRVFYRQKRLGQNGMEFMMYKFRSMYPDADTNTEQHLTKEKDPRITSVGRILRKLRLDEVPQLINVIEGEMSLVGPRPELPFYVQQYRQQIPLYSKRFRVKPGITGLAQVKQKFSESVKDIQKKLEYDLFYIENMSLRLDLKILLATVVTVLTRRGG